MILRVVASLSLDTYLWSSPNCLIVIESCAPSNTLILRANDGRDVESFNMSIAGCSLQCDVNNGEPALHPIPTQAVSANYPPALEHLLRSPGSDDPRFEIRNRHVVMAWEVEPVQEE